MQVVTVPAFGDSCLHHCRARLSVENVLSEKCRWPTKIARQSFTYPQVARVTSLLEALRGEVSEALTSFTNGGDAIEFQERMEKLGIKLDCNLDDLKKISMSQPAR
jgi:hypothetical protein